jgi:YVTN family beta-propeller protein
MGLALLAVMIVQGHTAPGQVVRTTTVGHMPGWVAVDARTTRAFVTNSVEHTVSVLDASTGAVLRTVALPGEPDFAATDVRTVAVGKMPDAVAVDAATGHVFVTNNGADTVTMLDAQNGTVLGTIKVGAQPAQIVLDERTQHVFVVHGRGGARFFFGDSSTGGTTMLDARSGAVLHAVAVGGSPTDDVGFVTAINLAMDARHGRVFVINPTATAAPDGAGRVSVLDARTGRLLRTLSVGRHPIALGVDETLARLFVVNTNSGCVRRSGPWDRLPGSVRRWLPFLPPASQPTCHMPGTVTVIDTSRL